MKAKKGSAWFYSILIFAILMVNPPVLGFVNTYCVANPLTFGWPTMFLWLEFWYVVMIVDFLVAAIWMKAWDCSQDQKEIHAVERK